MMWGRHLFVFLTNVFYDIGDGGLEELIHGFLCQPQHPLGGPLHDIHTDRRKKKSQNAHTPVTTSHTHTHLSVHTHLLLLRAASTLCPLCLL